MATIKARVHLKVKVKVKVSKAVRFHLWLRWQVRIWVVLKSPRVAKVTTRAVKAITRVVKAITKVVKGTRAVKAITKVARVKTILATDPRTTVNLPCRD